ncbi:hypothetical protein K488DRAFT_82301 [Vararia minispora EC-137]|uniref:Uncharacterized protein n=1 Tax=Vararia minispora EC-137 TaxID=1314806 RepID=A0ACB8QX09_9AGAM|nr:hypothetical protein K488DRAFT_82301 [Vararia minispora EC-137]
MSKRLENPGSVLVTSRSSSERDRQLLRLDVHQFPSNLRGVAEAIWTASITSSSALAFTFDFRQDLCIAQLPAGFHHFTVPSYQFLSMSNSLPHPLAAEVDYGPSCFPTIPPLLLGDHVISPQLHGGNDIWNWKTGQRMGTVPCQFFAIAFFDREHIMISMEEYNNHGPALLLYAIESPIANSAGDMLPPLSALGLPSFAEDVGVVQCAVRSSVCNGHSRSNFLSGPGPAFYNDDADRGVVVVTLTDGRELCLHEFAFPTTLLLSSLCRGPSDSSVFVPWDLWGPKITHNTFEREVAPSPANWHDFQLCGLRRVAPRPIVREDGALVVHVFDYHPRRVAYAAILPSSGAWSIHGGVSTSNSMDDTQVWAHPPNSSLPFVLSETRLPDELQLHDPQDIVLCLHEDGLTACVGSSPSRPHLIYIMAV